MYSKGMQSSNAQITKVESTQVPVIKLTVLATTNQLAKVMAAHFFIFHRPAKQNRLRMIVTPEKT